MNDEDINKWVCAYGHAPLNSAQLAQFRIAYDNDEVDDIDNGDEFNEWINDFVESLT